MHERILEALGAGIPVITAGGRLARLIRREFDAVQTARGAAAWSGPQITPWAAWMSSLWEEYQFATADPPVRLGAWQEWAIWNRVLRAAPEAEQILQLGATAAAAQRSWALAIEWRLDLGRVESEGGDDARAFARWAREYREFCDTQGLLEDARVPDRLRESLGVLRLPPQILLAGFDEFTPQQAEFLQAVRRAGCAAEVVYPPRRSGTGAAARVPFPDAEQSLTAAARWARALLEANPGESIGIVVPDLTARRAQVERIFHAILDPASQLPGARRTSLVNLTAGASLASHPMIRSALAILSARPDGNEWTDVSALVLDRYIAAAETERAARAALDVRLRKFGLAQITLAEARREAEREPASCPVLSRVFTGLLRVCETTPARQKPDAWARTFSAALEAAGWPGERPLQSVEYQTVEAWKSAVSEFAATDHIAGEMSRGDALALLTRIAQSTIFQPAGDSAPVQVMGTLEATGLNFDHLWVAGLDDETWPPPASPDPFLPVRLQREAGIPRCSPDRELSFAMLITHRLLASSPDVVVSYATHEGERELAPSPLILSLRPSSAQELRLWDAPLYEEVIRASRAVESLVDEQGPPLAEDGRQSGGAKVFQYQAACPFRAFVELRLGAQDLECPAPGLDAAARGTLVHATLEHFWKEVRTHEALCARADIPQVIRASAAWAIARLEERRGAPLPERFAQLERRRLERLSAEWLELEKLREPFEVVQPEGERQAEVGGIRFRLKLDRIDRLRDGSDVIVDYKTNTPTIASWDGDRPEEPQLPLYSAVYRDRPLAGVVFGQVKTGAVKFRGIADRAGIVPNAAVVELEPRIAEWRGVLEHLAADFRAGHAAADPKDPQQTCRYCKLAGLCRVSERDAAWTEEAAS